MIQTALKLDDLFPNGITSAWASSFILGDTRFYSDDYGIVSYCYIGDTLNILSTSIGEEPFTLPMIRDIITLIKSHKKVIIQTTRVKELAQLATKLNMTYDYSSGFYVKG